MATILEFHTLKINLFEDGWHKMSKMYTFSTDGRRGEKHESVTRQKSFPVALMDRNETFLVPGIPRVYLGIPRAYPGFGR